MEREKGGEKTRVKTTTDPFEHLPRNKRVAQELVHGHFERTKKEKVTTVMF